MKKIVVTAVLILTIAMGFLLVQRKTAPLTVWVFDIGQGDAIFIDGPEKQVLIDGGPNTDVLEKLGAVMLPWDRTLDVVILTHPHADHVFGLNGVLGRYDVAEVLSNRQPYDEPPAVAFAAKLPSTIVAGDRIDLGDGAVLETIWPNMSLEGTSSDDPNDGSVVMKLTYGETTMLLTGDAGIGEEDRFASLVGDIDVLKVGHHGSDTSTGTFLVNIVRPEVAIISVGEGNSYVHPSPIVVDRLINAGIEVFRTDSQGDVRVSSDGGEPQIATFSL